MQRHGQDIAEASLEILGKACELAEGLRVPAAGLLAGERVERLADQVIACGAGKAYVLQSPLLEEYDTIRYAAAFCDLIRRESPAIFLLAATPQGRDLAPRIASQLQVGLTADCTDLQIGAYKDPKSGSVIRNLLLQIRPAWGGNVIATIVNPGTRPQMATVREGVMKLPPPLSTTRGSIIQVVPAVPSGQPAATVLERQPLRKTVNLKRSNIIVAGGAGLGSKEHFNLIWQLAALLGGEAGATRSAVDAGFIGHEHQIGQTGVTVRPKLYIACGISGAVQHLAGMQESGKIVAINSDPEAPVFGVAHYGIIGDVRDVIPRMIGIYRTMSHSVAR